MLAFNILGPVRVVDDGSEVALAEDARALVARLVLAGGEPVAASDLAADLWPDIDTPTGLTRLRSIVDELCAGPVGPHVRVVPPGFALDLGGASLDSARFEALVAEAEAARSRGEAGDAMAALDTALALWDGEPAPELAARGVARGDRRRLADARAAAAAERADLALAGGGPPPPALVKLLEDLAEGAPVQERLWRLRAELLARSGRVEEARAALGQLRERLAGVLGIEPGPETADLERRLSGGETAAAPRPTRASPTPFVGRTRELGLLDARWQAAAAGRRGSVFLAGEPGIGKTRLAGELAALVTSGGGTVLYGRCDEDLGVAYQPFVEALGSLLASQPGLLGDELRRVTADLARLLPDLALLARQLPPPLRASPEAERWALFEAVVTLLSLASHRSPVLLVLDDLQWAATPTVLLLRHVLRTSRPLRLLVVGTYRDTEADVNPRLGELLADLAVDGTAERLQLGGLGADDVASLVHEAGHPLDAEGADLARSVYAETDGNPFFVQEMLRHLAEVGEDPGGAPGLPPGVREVVARRLDRLSPAANRVLAVAAVVGPTFEVEVLERIPDIAGDVATILDAVDEAIAAKVVEEVPSGALRFSHELIRHAVHESLSSTRRVRLHRRVGEALEGMTDRVGRLEALAFHFAEAAGDGQATKAATYALQAGRHLVGRLAYEGAASLLERGLSLLEAEPAPDRALRADLLLALGTARANAGDTTGAKEAGLRAADDARALGSAERLAQAAEVCFTQTGVGVVDANVTRVCEDALAGLGEDDPLTRARLLARFAFYQASNESRGEAAGPLAEQAIELARRAGDTDVLAAALFGRAVTLLGTARVEQRLALAGELLGVAAASDNQEERLQGLFLRGSARLELGDRGGFEADAAELGALAARVPSFKARYYDTAWRVMRTLLDGRFADTPARLDELGEMAGTDANARNVHAINTWLLYRETGRLAEVVPLLEAVVARNPALVGFQPALTLSLAELGRADEARDLLRALVADDCAAITRDMNWVASLGGLAESAAALGDGDAGAVIEPLLLPHAGRVLVPAAATYCTGTTERYLGMLAALRGDAAAAAARYEAAVALEEAIGAPPLAARTRLWLARLLAGPGDDHARAALLAADAGREAAELGMTALAEEAGAVLATLGPTP